MFWILFMTIFSAYDIIHAQLNRIILFNDHWIIFVETSMSSTLSTAKFIWNFPLRPDRKIN